MGRLRFKKEMLLTSSAICWWVYSLRFKPAVTHLLTAQTPIPCPVCVIVGSAILALGELVLLWAVGTLMAPLPDHFRSYDGDGDGDDDDDHKSGVQSWKITDICGLIMNEANWSVARLLVFASALFLLRTPVVADNGGPIFVALQAYALIFRIEYAGRPCFGLLVFLLCGVGCKEMIEPSPPDGFYGIHLLVKLVVCLLFALILLLCGAYLLISSPPRPPPATNELLYVECTANNV